MSGLRTISLLGVLLFSSVTAAQEKPLRQIIDAEIKAGWQKEKITPTSRSTDSVFLRRVYLDLVGVVPTYDETNAFLKDADPKKRAKLIDKLLDDPRFATQQAHVWDWCCSAAIRRTSIRYAQARRLQEMARRPVRQERAVRSHGQELLLAEQEGTELFYVQYRNAPEEAATAVVARLPRHAASVRPLPRSSV